MVAEMNNRQLVWWEALYVVEAEERRDAAEAAREGR
jgi:hypothetical protein